MVIGKCAGVFWGIFFSGGGVEKRVYVGGTFYRENFSWGKKISIEGAQYFLELFKKKNNEKINMKKFFSWK